MGDPGHEISPGQGCIICDRVRDGEPILYAVREEPMDEGDSGWQFLCGSDDHEDGGEGAVLACLDAIFVDDALLQAFTEQPVGAELERPSWAHALARIDLGEAGDVEFTCGSCDEVHRGMPLNGRIPWPNYFQESEDDDWRLDDPTAVWKDEHCFFRSRLQIPVLDGPGPFCYDVWVTVAPERFDEVCRLFADGTKEITEPIFGWFATKLPGYPDTVHLKSQSRFVPGEALPLLQLEPTDHPLAVEQYGGITLERLGEITAPMLHDV